MDFRLSLGGGGEAEENNLFGSERGNSSWERWSTCSLCEQEYYGVVTCALGWACWKTYLGRPEGEELRINAMNLLGLGLSETEHITDELSVKKAEFSMLRRLGATEDHMLGVQTNLASTYHKLGRNEQALAMRRDVYSGCIEIYGVDHARTILAANNYAIYSISKRQSRLCAK